MCNNSSPNPKHSASTIWLEYHNQSSSRYVHVATLFPVSICFTSHGSTFALPPRPTTHTHSQLCSHVSSSNLTMHFSLTGHSAQPHLSPHARVTTLITCVPRDHTNSSLPAECPLPRLPAQTKLPPKRTPPIGRHAVSRLFISDHCFSKTRGEILCHYLYHSPQPAGVRGKETALRLSRCQGPLHLLQYLLFSGKITQNPKLCFRWNLKWSLQLNDFSISFPQK